MYRSTLPESVARPMYSSDVALCLVEQVRQTAVWDFPDGPIIEFDSMTTSVNRRSLICSPSVAFRTECIWLSGPALSDVYFGPTVFALVFELADVCHIYVEWWDELVSIGSALFHEGWMALFRDVCDEHSQTRPTVVSVRKVLDSSTFGFCHYVDDGSNWDECSVELVFDSAEVVTFTVS